MDNHNKNLLEDEIVEDHIEKTNHHNGENCSKCKSIQLESNQKLMMVNLIHSNESDYIIIDADSKIDKNTQLIIESRYGKDMAIVTGEILSLKAIPEKHVCKIIRIATEKDISRNDKNIEKEEKAVKTCREKIASHKLDMKLVSAHYLVDESKILFFFTADARVDFRELVKDLVTIFKMRIELRQIGVRDESRIIGGLALCGRDYCCHSVTDHLNPVSIKMAKEQNLSLNSMKISGPCGRLLCCLSYEYDFYKQEKKLFPSLGTQMTYEGQRMRVSELNIISRFIKLTGQDGQSIEIPLNNLKFLNKQRKWMINKVSESDQNGSSDIPEIVIEGNSPRPGLRSEPKTESRENRQPKGRRDSRNRDQRDNRPQRNDNPQKDGRNRNSRFQDQQGYRNNRPAAIQERSGQKNETQNNPKPVAKTNKGNQTKEQTQGQNQTQGQSQTPGQGNSRSRNRNSRRNRNKKKES